MLSSIHPITFFSICDILLTRVFAAFEYVKNHCDVMHFAKPLTYLVNNQSVHCQTIRRRTASLDISFLDTYSNLPVNPRVLVWQFR